MERRSGESKMIAMQYKIVLPADYPMEKIEARIREKGYLLDGYPGLVFKAYLYSRKDAENYKTSVNSYAPFYIWQDHQSMVSFLKSDGFRGLCEQFGQPEVKIWFVDGEAKVPDSECSFTCIHHQVSLDADVYGLNFTSWNTLGVTWITHSELLNEMDGDIYSVGYVAHGKKAFS